MATTNLFAGIATADLPAARAYYERFFGRGPDLIPNDDEAAWRLTDDAWVYVVADAPRAGGAVLTLLVDDLDAQLAGLRERGIEPPATQPVGGGRSVRIDGPEDAMIQLAQVPEG